MAAYGWVHLKIHICGFLAGSNFYFPTKPCRGKPWFGDDASLHLKFYLFEFPFLTIFSNAYAAPASAVADHVDYGAYTGGYGAFGWYSDHPVLLGAHH